jgi:HEAT repeat protein
MKKRIVLWVVVVLVIATVGAMFIPGSPISLDRLLGADSQSIEGHSLRYWKKEMSNQDKEVRLKAIETVGKFGADGGDAVADVARLLSDPDDDIRIAASVTLVKLAPNTKTVVPTLIEALNDKNLQVRQNTINALIRLRKDAYPAVPTLIEAVKNPENKSNANLFLHTIQEGAISALGYVSEGTGDAVPTLVEVLKGDSNDKMKAAAARSLGLIGPAAKEAIPTLYEMLKQKDRHVREESNIALRALGEKIEPFQLTAEDKKLGQLKKPKDDGKGPKKDDAKKP